MARPAAIPSVYLYIQRQAASTNAIIMHLNHHIDGLMREMQIHKTYVDTSTLHAIRRVHNIARTPCLVVGRNMIYDVEKILQTLTPRRAATAGAYGALSDEEQVANYMQSFTDPSLDMSEDGESTQDSTQITQRMYDLQKRRPQMNGVPGAPPGGRKMPVRKAVPMATFDSDDKFLQGAGLDNIDETPSQNHFSQYDGDSILEEERLDEARHTAGYKAYNGRRGRR